jgi:NAD(P)-dependent dehydrogenase (short-subunit alcohol dehydrogenase family)
MSDQVVLVTGATDGIGEEMARGLAAQGALVLVHGRSADRVEAAGRRIGGRWEPAVADLASFAQVRALAEDVARRHPQLDGLANVAGVGYLTAPQRGARTEDGREVTWQVNFLAPFLLTFLLGDALADGGGRVVHVSSGVQASGAVDLERPDEPRTATPYTQSKIAMVMHARELGDRWRGRGVDVNACDPGWIATKMGGTGGGSLAEGADTPLWLLTDPALEGTTGGFFWHRRPETPNRQVEDAGARRRLWDLAASQVGLEGDEFSGARRS